jgi:hypothetical protein
MMSVAVIACAAALVPLVALAVTASPSTAAGETPAASPPACATSGLVVWLYSPIGGGTAGGTYYDLEFTNLSGHTCTLYGYPGVSAVNLVDHQLGSAGARNDAHPSTVVTLANGTSAIAVLKITDVGVFSPLSCHYATAAGLRVYPPNQTASKVVPFPFASCALTGPVFLHVEAVQKA